MEMLLIEVKGLSKWNVHELGRGGGNTSGWILVRNEFVRKRFPENYNG